MFFFVDCWELYIIYLYHRERPQRPSDPKLKEKVRRRWCQKKAQEKEEKEEEVQSTRSKTFKS